jgi:F-type H+-transporting ATPase subunit delta
MANYQVASRYAKSLLDLSIEKNELDKTYGDMETVSSALKSRELYLLFKSPIIKSDKKLSIVREIFTGKIDKMTLGFIELITSKGRESNLPEIVESFKDQYKIYNNITDVKVTTAVAMTNEAKASLEKALQDSSVTAQKVEINTSVKEDLIGGFVIEIGDKLYDASVKHKLSKIRKEFTENK